MTTTRKGYFGQFGGQFVPETLMTPLTELEEAFTKAWSSAEFQAEFQQYLVEYANRPSPLYHAKRLSEAWKSDVYLKREDLNHTGAHKINNTLGQILLARKMGKTRIIAETGAGQHGVATATVCALFGMPCIVYMGKEDTERQALNVFRMEQLGAEVRPVTSGTMTLKDACNEALRDWVTNVRDTFYILGSATGPHPYPTMVREFQSVIGKEARQQMMDKAKKLPDNIFACVGGGSNAIGIFHPFLEDTSVELMAAEAAGLGVTTGHHAVSIGEGKVGVFQGAKSYVLQTEEGQIFPAECMSAGLDYPGVGPEHSFLHDTKRASYHAIEDDLAVSALQELCRMEGIVPALESSYAVALAKQYATKNPGKTLLINLSGRGDKDVAQIRDYLNKKEANES